ncbi:adenylosuccinate lyase family protein [Streptomyces sp. NPDC047000]|uniref:class-II fumarase/aspartase family protein n=1 Tax=Streptomyces sp. NPDC047000 TaxID=3155474 RepID=UPI00340B0817
MTGAGVDAGLLSPVRAGTPVEEATSDEAWIQAMLDAETALVRAQCRFGLVPVGAAEAIGRAARAEAVDPVALAREARGAANPVVGLVRRLTELVAARDPAAAEYVHRGSTSQDIMDTAAVLVIRRALGLVLDDLDNVAAALARLAERHRDDPMAGRTLALQAVPVTFGLKAAGWLLGVLDARAEVHRVRESLPAQLGGAAGTLAGYVEHARRTLPAEAGAAGPGGYAARLLDAYAAETGLAVPVLPWHTARAPFAATGAALTQVTGALGKLAVDVQTLSRTEIGEVAEPVAAGRGVSSAMPHKRNPALATLIRAAAQQVPALALVLAGAMLAEDERPAGLWHSEWQPLRDALRLAGGAAHTAVELTRGLVVRPDRMRENLALTGSLMATERVAAVLAPVVGRVRAKTLLSAAVDRAAADGRPLAEILLDDPGTAPHLSAGELTELLDPTRYTGVAGPLVDRTLDHYRATLPVPVAVP